VDAVITEAPSSADHSQALFFALHRVLRPDGALVVLEPLEGRTFEISERLKGYITLAGFLTATITPNPPFVEVRFRDGFIFVYFN